MAWLRASAVLATVFVTLIVSAVSVDAATVSFCSGSAPQALSGSGSFFVNETTIYDFCVPSDGKNAFSILMTNLVRQDANQYNATVYVQRNSAYSPGSRVQGYGPSELDVPVALNETMCFDELALGFTLVIEPTTLVANMTGWNATFDLDYSYQLEQFGCLPYEVTFLPSDNTPLTFFEEYGTELIISGMIAVVLIVWITLFVRSQQLDSDVTTTTTAASPAADRKRSEAVEKANKSLADEPAALVPDNEPAEEPKQDAAKPADDEPKPEVATLGPDGKVEKSSSGSRASSGKKHRKKSRKSSGGERRSHGHRKSSSGGHRKSSKSSGGHRKKSKDRRSRDSRGSRGSKGDQ